MIDPFLLEEISAARGEAFMAEARPFCAYFRSGGVCSFGCWEEPVCHTEEPYGGWEWRAYEVRIDLAEMLRAAVREDRGDLSHAEVKRLRDMAREEHCHAVRLLAVAE